MVYENQSSSKRRREEKEEENSTSPCWLGWVRLQQSQEQQRSLFEERDGWVGKKKKKKKFLSSFIHSFINSGEEGREGLTEDFNQL